MAILDKFTVVDLFETRSDSVATINGNTLRFNKQTVEELDFPPFIQILVNTQDKQFAIRVCKENEVNAVGFSKPKGEQRGPVKISAPAVVKMIRKMGGWGTDENWNFPGAYFHDEDDENVSVTNFGNGFLKFSGTSGDMITVTRFEILNVKLAEITEISLTIPNSYFYVLASGVRVATNITANGGVYGVYATNGSTLVCAGTVEVNNTTNYAIVTTSGSRCFIQNIIGTNNKVMAASTLGGIFTYGTSTLSSTSQFYTDTGGRVFSGAQTNAPVN